MAWAAPGAVRVRRPLQGIPSPIAFARNALTCCRTAAPAPATLPHPGITPAGVIRGDRDNRPMGRRRSHGWPGHVRRRVDSVVAISLVARLHFPGRSERRWRPGLSPVRTVSQRRAVQASARLRGRRPFPVTSSTPGTPFNELSAPGSPARALCASGIYGPVWTRGIMPLGGGTRAVAGGRVRSARGPDPGGPRRSWSWRLACGRCFSCAI